MPNYVKPGDLVEAIVAAGTVKSKLGWIDLILRSMYSGILLGFATTLAITATTQTSTGIVGALVFPCGFVLIVLFGMELVTGNFAVISVAWLAKKATMKGLWINWLMVWFFNFMGCLFYLGWYIGPAQEFGKSPYGATAVQDSIRSIAFAKTTYYNNLGVAGWFVCFFKAVLCNWMVCIGTFAALTSTSVSGKIIAAWLPIVMFFGQGFEHAVVNMFVIPCGMALGADVNWVDFLFWNIVPVTMGNMLAAILFVAVPFWVTWGGQFRAKEKKKLEEEAEKLPPVPIYPALEGGMTYLPTYSPPPVYSAAPTYAPQATYTYPTPITY